ncbi:MAG: cytochrome c biogenesis protein CcsA [Bacteroidales bacterium]|jgi:ABC-type transport system involved in cytochrome c biogenesis permease subunit
MIINYTSTFVIIASCWIAGLILLYLPIKFLSVKKKVANLLLITGAAILLFYIGNLWFVLERPPFKTLGETRLWYAFFLAGIGLILYFIRKMSWVPFFSMSFAFLFLIINLIHPENFDKTLMPALQSLWFVPHVIVYIFAYSLLFASTIVAFKGLIGLYKKTYLPETLILADKIVFIGFGFLTFGLLFGALWAKEAWGNYWTWDPKETWSFLTWLLYLIYIHYRHYYKKAVKSPLFILTIAFIILLICWFGVNYLPSAANSVHTYTN